MTPIQTPPQMIHSASPGLWAGQRFRQAGLSSAALRTNDVLRKDEWQRLDETLVREGLQRLVAFADVLDAGLVLPVDNPLGVTEIQVEQVSDAFAAERSMSGVARTSSDTPDFQRVTFPNFITHVDFDIDLRHLEASRSRGEPLDTTNAEQAARRVAESLEDALLNGGPTFGGNASPGYRTHPNRNTGTFQTNGAWDQAAKTGEDVLEDVLFMMDGLRTDRFFGPYWLYVPSNFERKLDEDFKSNSDLTVRQRLERLESLAAVRIADQLAASEVVLVQATSDVVTIADGEGITPVTWDLTGGFQTKMKVWALQVPLVKSTHSGRSGIFHLS